MTDLQKEAHEFAEHCLIDMETRNQMGLGVNVADDLAFCYRAGAEERGRSEYKQGYSDAVHDFGIWKDGVQRIGCLETPIKKVLDRKFGEVMTASPALDLETKSND